MGVLVDDKHKFLFVLPHKCGQISISSYLYRLNVDQNVKNDYYSPIFGNFDYNKSYDDYYKILILRNPYKRFISGFLQDCTDNQNNFYRNFDITFKEFCNYLKEIYYLPNVYYENCLLTNNHKFKNKLSAHLESQYVEIHNYLDYFDHKFDKIIFTENINDLLIDLNNKLNKNIDISIGNQKSYVNYDIDIKNIKVNLIATGHPYPHLSKFYNDDIKKIVEEIYEEDFNLIEKFNLNIAFEDIFDNNILTDKVIDVNNVQNYNSEFCLLIIPNDNKLEYFEKFYESLNKNCFFDTYILQPKGLYTFCDKQYKHPHMYYYSYDNTVNVLSNNIADEYLNLFSKLKKQYQYIVIYNDYPVFNKKIDNFKHNFINIEEINFEQDTWCHIKEIIKDSHLLEYTKYCMNYNGLVINFDSFFKLFTEVNEIASKKTGNYPVLEIILPTLINQKYDKNEFYQIDYTMWEDNDYLSMKLSENYISFTDKLRP